MKKILSTKTMYFIHNVFMVSLSGLFFQGMFTHNYWLAGWFAGLLIFIYWGGYSILRCAHLDGRIERIQEEIDHLDKQIQSESNIVDLLKVLK